MYQSNLLHGHVSGLKHLLCYSGERKTRISRVWLGVNYISKNAERMNLVSLFCAVDVQIYTRERIQAKVEATSAANSTSSLQCWVRYAMSSLARMQEHRCRHNKLR